MKFLEFYAQASGADRSDPLLSIVKNLNDEKARLVELRRQTQGYLIPISVKGKTSIVADPDLAEETATLAAQIESSKARIADLEERIVTVDEICAKYGIERPVMRDLQRQVGFAKSSIIRAKAKAAGVLGHVLSFKCQDEEQAKLHPLYLRAVKEYEARKSAEPHIAKLEKCLAELRTVL